jgi:hypothetical protein
VHGLHLGRAHETLHALCEHERRRRRPVVPCGLTVHGAERGAAALVLGRLEEVAEEDRRAQDAFTDLHQPKARNIRNPACTAEADDLAAFRRAGARQTARAERDPPVEAVDRAEAEEAPRDRALAEEDECCRLSPGEAAECVPRSPVELGAALVALARQAAPDGAHGLLLGRELAYAEPDAPVLGDQAPGKHRREHGRACGDADGGE